MQAEFTTGETIFLIVATAAFAVFALSLLFCQIDYQRRLRQRSADFRTSTKAENQPAE